MTTKVAFSWALTQCNFDVSEELLASVIRVGEISEDGSLHVLFMSK